MAQEIERKFLVKGEFRMLASEQRHIAQGYLCSHPERTVRVRLCDERAYLTIKGKSSADGVIRYEWENEISLEEAHELLQMCEPGVIEKTRYFIPFEGHCIEVDEFHGENEGLLLAEVELTDPEEKLVLPDWIGEEVTGNLRYYNVLLCRYPFREW